MSIFGFATFCDDIRFENNGKGLIIGFYPDDIIPGFLPQTLSMSFWVRLSGMPAGKTELTMNIGMNDRMQQNTVVTLEVHDANRPANLYLIGVPVTLEETGHIFLEITGLPNGETFKDTLLVRSPPSPHP